MGRAPERLPFPPTESSPRRTGGLGTAAAVHAGAVARSAGPMRVGIVLGQLDLGGSEGQALGLAAGLSRRGHEVGLFSFRDGPRRSQAAALGIPCRVPAFPWVGGGVLAFTAWLRRLRPQAVYTFTFRGNLWGRCFAALRGAQVLVAGYRQHREYWFDRFTLKWNRAVVCNCHAVAELVEHRYRLPAGCVRVIPNGVDLQAFRDRGSGPDALTRLGLTPGLAFVVQVARLHRNKDHETALRALELVRRVRPEVQLVLVGDGPRRDELRRRASSVGESTVRFLGAQREVAPILAAARVGWLSSRIEGLPNAVLEYMAAGLPVVATRAGGTGELIRDGVEGFLVDPGDAQAMAQRTLEILADEGLRMALGRAGRRRVEEGFTLETMVERSEQLLRELVAVRRSGGRAG